MDKMSVRDIDVKGKRVLVRVDYNVPFNKDGIITDDSRIRASMPTIDYLVQQNAKVIICSHMGRPDGKVVEELRLEKTGRHLANLMRQEVKIVDDCIGLDVENEVSKLKEGEIILLENLRFHTEEEDNDPIFAQALSRLAEVYVDDAFGTAHRNHASITGVTKYLPSVSGLLLEKELVSLGRVLEQPPRPFCVLLGGAKVSDKVAMLENVMDKVDSIIIGGGMAAIFLKALGYEVGDSLLEDGIDIAKSIMEKAKEKGIQILLPEDVVVAREMSNTAATKTVPVDCILPEEKILDIGSLTITNYSKKLERCKTVFWNGPMGVYELEPFAEGTRAMARIIAHMHGNTIIGGGSTSEIVTEMRLADKMSFVSTGGGASLKYLSGNELPGVEALDSKATEIRCAYKMEKWQLIKQISRETDSKIVLFVIDGLGGLPHPKTGKSELQTANLPNLDRLAASSVCGLVDPVGPGITPGSAPGHLALFGYDPVDCVIGRGVLEALGIDYPLSPDELAVRCNFCTLDDKGNITDRRAGRISTEQNRELCEILDGQEIDGVSIKVKSVKDHRFIVIFKGEGLYAEVTESDPQQLGAPPRKVEALKNEAQWTANIVNKFIARSAELLKEHKPANMLLMRGFSKMPNLPTFKDIYKLNAAAIASYPMYRGLSKVVGMEVLPTGTSLESEIETLKKYYDKYNFFFVHAKEPDAAGEDGDFDRKVKALERIDKALEDIVALKPDVLLIAGDHSTPATFVGHSWHPVPVLLSSKWNRADGVKEFTESACLLGGLTRMPATQLMSLAMANALKLDKFGA